MTRLLERIRRPEYTGENRCWPCTITNSVLLTIVVGVLALVGRRTAAAIVGAVGVVSLGLRGYVVPYTPRFAPSLAAVLPTEYPNSDEPGSLSDSAHVEAADSESGTDSVSGEDVLTTLLETGVVVPDGEDLYLDAEFRDDWRQEMHDLREHDLEGLANIADQLTEPTTDARVSRGWGRSVLVLEDTSGGVTTLRRGIAVAELAAARALESTVDDAAVRRAAGRPLRSLLEACPLCDGPLEVTQSSCCGEVTPVGATPSEKLYCPDCNVRLFTFD